MPNTDNLNYKVCVITGGTGIIGSEIASGLAKKNTNVAIIGRNEEKGLNIVNNLTSKYKTKSIFVKADVLDEKSLINARNEINDRLGKIEILINCAGGNSPQASTQKEYLEDISEIEDSIIGLKIPELKKTFDLNFYGTLLPITVFTKDMIEAKKGAILNISSMASLRPLTKIPAYSASKAAVNNFTQWLAVHYSKVNIRVNAIAPGFFITEQNKFLLQNENGNLTERGEKIINNTPMQRFGTAKELRGIASLLVSDKASFITGTVIPVDGGFNAFSGV